MEFDVLRILFNLFSAKHRIPDRVEIWHNVFQRSVLTAFLRKIMSKPLYGIYTFHRYMMLKIVPLSKVEDMTVAEIKYILQVIANHLLF